MFYVNGKELLMDRGTTYSAGLDIKSDSTVIVKQGFNILTTGLSWKRNEKLWPYFGWLKERSGVALKHQSIVIAGIIDADYIEPIKVLLMNFGPQWELQAGKAFCQILLIPHVMIKANVLQDIREGGFGSTDKAIQAGNNSITTTVEVTNLPENK